MKDVMKNKTSIVIKCYSHLVFRLCDTLKTWCREG